MAGTKFTYPGEVNFEGQNLLSPGESHLATVRFYRFDDTENYIKIGRLWWIFEGSRKVGEARIIEILNKW